MSRETLHLLPFLLKHVGYHSALLLRHLAIVIKLFAFRFYFHFSTKLFCYLLREGFNEIFMVFYAAFVFLN
jgi:hypothetical protein